MAPDYAAQFVWYASGVAIGVIVTLLVVLGVRFIKRRNAPPLRQRFDPHSEDVKNEIARQLLAQLLDGPAVVRIEVIDKGSIVQLAGGKRGY